MVALLLRLPGLGASFYGDEGFSLLRDSNAWLTPTDDRFRPVYFTLLYLWKQLGFHGEVGLRSLSLLFGVLQVPVGYALGRRLAGKRFAVALALLLCVDPILVEFSQELRMYSLVALVALLQAWAFVVATAREAEGRPALGPWLGFVLAGIVGVYTHLHYWFLLVGFGVAILRRRGIALRPGVAAMAAIATAYLPDVPNVIRFGREGGEQAHLMATDLPSALPKLVVAYLVGFNYPQLPDMGLDRAIRPSVLGPNLGLAVLAGVPVLVIGVKLVRMYASRKPGSALWLGIELFAVPVAVSFATAAVTGRNFVHPKYMIFSAPFLVVTLSAGFLALGRRAYQVVGAMGAATLPRCVRTLPGAGQVRAPRRPARRCRAPEAGHARGLGAVATGPRAGDAVHRTCGDDALGVLRAGSLLPGALRHAPGAGRGTRGPLLSLVGGRAELRRPAGCGAGLRSRGVRG